jgi:hypothetical protein
MIHIGLLVSGRMAEIAKALTQTLTSPSDEDKTP